jgi:uncharacterized Fe-S cluster protein YjdI
MAFSPLITAVYLLSAIHSLMTEVIKQYTNGEVTIVWKPASCIHSRICWNAANGLPSVFSPKERPWVKPAGGTTEQIIAQVKKCPSGALSFFMNEAPEAPVQEKAINVVEVVADGPLLVHGSIDVKHADGSTISRADVTAFCRCGASSNKPYCDGTHLHNGFNG